MNYQKFVDNKKNSFLVTLVHDLKTPTYAQLNTLSMLNRGVFGKLNSEQREMISLTQESCRYMSNLIGTIMETYNCDCGEINLQKSNFDIAKLVSVVCEEADILSKENNQRIVFHNECQNPMIYADMLQMRRVVFNLLSNAVTYGFKGTVIDVVLKSYDNNIEFYVKNMSKQIPENELATVFDKYKKTKFSLSKKVGTGLGLYLVRQITELHCGRVYANSYTDGSCIFGFVVPVYVADKKRYRFLAKSAS